jgi:type II secretory pathway pseudopilin PulG
MSDLTIGFVLVLVAVIGLVAATARITLSASSKVLHRIGEALTRVRLFKMLQKRRVDVQSYLKTTGVSEIRQHIEACESCSSSQTCETALASDKTAIDDFSFCPNSAAIERAQGSTPILQDKPQKTATRCCRV